MKDRVISRRDFLRLTAGAATGAALAACKPQIVKETVIVEKPVEKIVKETLIVEKPVEKVVEKVVKETVVVEATGEKNGFGYVEWHPDKPVELSFWSHNTNDPAGPGAVDRRAIEGFMSMYPNVSISTNPSSWDAGGAPMEKLAAAYAAGSGTPDVMTTHGYPEICLQNGWALPVTEDMMPEEDRRAFGYVDMRLLETAGDDRIVDLASLVHGGLMFYRVDLLEEAGYTINDFGEFIEDAIPLMQELTLKDTDGTITRSGWLQRPHRMFQLVAQAGGDVINRETGQLTWSTDEAFRYVCQFWRDMHQKYEVLSSDIPWRPNHMADGLTVCEQSYSWMCRHMRVNNPDVEWRSRPWLRLKPGDNKGFLSNMYSLGIAVSAQIDDPVRERTAIEFWKYCYYNVSIQADLGYENSGPVLLKNSPDYAKAYEGIPPTGLLNSGQRTAETLYWSWKDLQDRDRWPLMGRLDNWAKFFVPMLEEIGATQTPLEDILKKYEAEAQSDWDENHWWVPGLVAV